MKKLFLDTNIILDLLGYRMPFYTEAAQLFSMADKKKVKLSISSLCIADAHYILSRQNPETEVRQILRKFKVLVNVLPLDDKITDLALNSDFRDFEDAIQYYTAIENDQDLIVTRNQLDFKESKISVMSAGEFIKSLKK
ncbi:MAG TPA: PIN domain-containing protein [Bacteroidales bacterium]|nr:PIN domain-containing protein [Bacteroidales bacterium]HUX55752.1 PIN domain-containing protein [Bacteroidales bacterium]